MGAAPQRSARVFFTGGGAFFADPLALPPGSFRRGAGRVGLSQMFSRLALRFVFVSWLSLRSQERLVIWAAVSFCLSLFVQVNKRPRDRLSGRSLWD